MEICNVVNIEMVGERRAQTLMKHWKSFWCPKLDDKHLVTFHLTQLWFLPMKLQRHLLLTLHLLCPHLHLMHLMWWKTHYHKYEERFLGCYYTNAWTSLVWALPPPPHPPWPPPHQNLNSQVVWVCFPRLLHSQKVWAQGDANHKHVSER